MKRECFNATIPLVVLHVDVSCNAGGGFRWPRACRCSRKMKKDAGRRGLLLKLHESLDMGEPLGTAMEKTDEFPKYVLDMVDLGERTGNLDRVLKSLSEYYERQEQVSKSIKTPLCTRQSCWSS